MKPNVWVSNNKSEFELNNSAKNIVNSYFDKFDISINIEID